MSKRILVTGVGGDIGQSVIKCLKGINSHFVIVGCDTDPFAAGRSVVNSFFMSPWASDAMAYGRFISKLVSKEKIDYVFPTSEPEIMFYDSHREYYSKNNITIFINDSYCIKTFFDKLATAIFLKKHGFLYPKTYLLDDFEGQLPYPVILKQRHGWGGKGMKVIHNFYDLSYYKKTCKNAVVQERVGSPDEEYTAGVFSDGKKTFSIGFKRSLGYGSLTKVAILVLDDNIVNLAKKLAGVLKLKGSLNIQLRRTAKGYMPLEINPRFSSTVYVRFCFGFQEIRWWMNLFENRKIEFKLKYIAGVAVRSLSEAFFELKK